MQYKATYDNNYHTVAIIDSEGTNIRHRQTGSITGLNNKPYMDVPVALNMYSMGGEPCSCTKQVTIHVIIMALAGVAYLGIGGIAGYYIGKGCKYNCYMILLKQCLQ